MLSSMPRSAASEMDQRASPSSLRTTRGQLNPSKSSKPLDRRTSTKIASLSEVEERSLPNEEQRNFKKVPSKRGEIDDGISNSDVRIKELEVEVTRVKDSESKMLESLMSQTKQLEETKIELEEAKLEIRFLQETIRTFQSPKGSKSSRNVEKNLDRGNSVDTIHTQEEMSWLRNELKMAIGAEEKSKKAMDDLAAALKEVASESKEAKEKLLLAQTELLDTKSKGEYTHMTLKSTEEKLLLALEEVQRLKIEAEESATAWKTQQQGFRDCVGLLEKEIAQGKQKNDRQIEEQRTSKIEISKMQDIMKHALNEATIVKEALEIATNENSQLKDTISEKVKASKKIEHELESIKVSEAAALGSVKELKNLLAANSNLETTNTSAGSSDSGFSATPKPSNAQMKDPDKVLELPTRISGDDNPRRDSLNIKVSDVRSESLRFPPGYSERVKNQDFGSFGSFSSQRGPILEEDDRSNTCYDDHDQCFSGEFLPGRNSSNTPAVKKKRMFRKFTDILRRRSSSK